MHFESEPETTTFQLPPVSPGDLHPFAKPSWLDTFVDFLTCSAKRVQPKDWILDVSKGDDQPASLKTFSTQNTRIAGRPDCRVKAVPVACFETKACLNDLAVPGPPVYARYTRRNTHLTAGPSRFGVLRDLRCAVVDCQGLLHCGARSRKEDQRSLTPKVNLTGVDRLTGRLCNCVTALDATSFNTYSVRHSRRGGVDGYFRVPTLGRHQRRGRPDR